MPGSQTQFDKVRPLRIGLLELDGGSRKNDFIS